MSKEIFNKFKHKCEKGESDIICLSFKSGSKENVIITKYKCKDCNAIFYDARTITGDKIGYTQEYLSQIF